jgi:hypothetical protein
MEPRRIHPDPAPNDKPTDRDELRDQLHDLDMVQGWLDALDEDDESSD